jgi:outer membrane lipoprotein SlyB
MNVRHRLAGSALAIAAAFPLLLAAPSAEAQTDRDHREAAAAVAPLRIESFGVEPVRRVGAGSELAFTLRGTPHATVTLQIAGAVRPLTLAEVRPGRYEGSYTVGRRDRIDAASRVTAQLRHDGRMASATLDQSVVAGAPSPAASRAAIADFRIVAPERVRPGDELRFALTGTPGGRASVAVQGVSERIALAETHRGVYEGDYTVRRGDRLRGELVATGHLRANGRESVQRYTRDANGSRDEERFRNGREDERFRHGRDVSAAPACRACGVVEAVNVVETKNDGNNVIGTIAGGVLGGVLGHQVGGGTGKDVATVAGALGGAYAGNRVQDSMDKSRQHQVVVRLDDGSTQTFLYAADPGVKAGDRVRVENEALVRM